MVSADGQESHLLTVMFCNCHGVALFRCLRSAPSPSSTLGHLSDFVYAFLKNAKIESVKAKLLTRKGLLQLTDFGVSTSAVLRKGTFVLCFFSILDRKSQLYVYV